MTSLVTLVMIIICWNVSAALGFGMIFRKLKMIGVEVYYYENMNCDGGCTLFQSKAGLTVFSVICFYVPAFLMLCVYINILHAAQQQIHAIQSMNSELRKNNSDLSHHGGVSDLLDSFFSL